MFKFSKTDAQVLDVGSSKLTVMAGTFFGEKCSMTKSCELYYSGFLNGEFISSGEIAPKIKNAIENVEMAMQLSIKNITVGVPAEFCYSITKKLTATFATKQKLTQAVVDEIYQKAIEDFDGYTFIEIQPVQTTLDNNQKCVSPLGCKASQLSIFVNIIYAKTTFVQMFNNILSEIGVEKVSYVCSPLCVAKLLGQTTLNGAVVIDVGYLTSSVCVAKGDGLQNLFSFSFGGAQIEAQLMEEFALTFDEAEDLKKNIVLTLEAKNGDMYETSSFGKTRKIMVKKANQVVAEKLETLGYIIKSCFEQAEIDNNLPIYLTGGGISQLQGAKTFLEKYLGCKIDILSPNLLGFNKPYHSSSVGLLNYQIKSQQKHAFFVAK